MTVEAFGKQLQIFDPASLGRRFPSSEGFWEISGDTELVFLSSTLVFRAQISRNDKIHDPSI